MLTDKDFTKRYVPVKYPIVGGTMEIIVRVKFSAKTMASMDSYVADLMDKVMVKGSTRTIQQKHEIGIKHISFEVPHASRPTPPR